MDFSESTLAYGGGNIVVVSVILVFLLLVLFLGYVIGSFLAKRVKGKHMIIGSAAYWTAYLINLYLVLRYSYYREFIYQNLAIYTLSSIFLFWGLVVLPINITYLVKHIVSRLKHSDVQK